MIRNQKLIQAISEAIIPLLGFFFFDWGLYFILLYYFIDLFVTEAFLHLKAKKIITFQTKQAKSKNLFLYGTVSFVFVVATFLLAHLVMSFIDKEIIFYQEVVAFLAYEEVGVPIAQGYILLPLVILGNYQQYKMFFLMPAKYRVVSIKELFNSRIKALSMAIIGSLIALVLAYFTPVSEVVYLLVLAGVKFFVDFKMRN